MLTATLTPTPTSVQLAAARCDAGGAGQRERAIAQLRDLVAQWENLDGRYAALNILGCGQDMLDEALAERMVIGAELTNLRVELGQRGWLPSMGGITAPSTWMDDAWETEAMQWNQLLAEMEASREY